jgi:hypothetical protein
MLSTSIFGSDGKRYNQTAVFGPTFSLNHTALEEYGLPHLTGSNVWTNMTACWSVSHIIVLNLILDIDYLALDRWIDRTLSVVLAWLCYRLLQAGKDRHAAGQALGRKYTCNITIIA